jgi:ABC-2 type transport system ATP-binding protein
LGQARRDEQGSEEETVNAVISANNLCKSFRRLRVLDNLNLDVPSGSIFALIGPNGAGKTTTIKILMNILKPTSGQAEVLSVDSRKLGPSHFDQIGYVSENQEIPEWMTVDYFLAYLKRFYPAWDDARADELLNRFSLPRGRKLRHLSRGMRMKAALISSLAYRPHLLVLDEPFGGLDPLVREDLIEGLVDSAGETAILISSHDLSDIESFASHIGYLDAGRMHFSEEMTSLTARFREVEVIVDAPANIPTGREWPENWLRPEATPAVVRFVETRFEPDRTSAEIRRVFRGAQQVSMNPMPLRSIFVTLARSASKTA